MVPKESGCNQLQTVSGKCAREARDVFHARLPRQGMVALYKGSTFVITEAQFTIVSQVM